MKERERLIELLNVNMSEDCGVWDMADYLLDNGVAILPCKVGDKVYRIDENGQIESNVITEIIDIECKCNFYASNGYLYNSSKYGSPYNLFFSKEEAEKALERSKRNE